MKIAFAALVFVVYASAADTPPVDYDKNAPLDLKEQPAAVRHEIRVSFIN